MRKKCSKFYWCTSRELNFIETVYELSDIPSYISYRDFTITVEGLQDFRPWSTPFEQKEIFIVLFLVRHRASVYTDSSENLTCLVAFFEKPGHHRVSVGLSCDHIMTHNTYNDKYTAYNDNLSKEMIMTCTHLRSVWYDTSKTKYNEFSTGNMSKYWTYFYKRVSIL